jgi:hypothetical protein
MSAMSSMVEALESRQFLSAAPAPSDPISFTRDSRSSGMVVLDATGGPDDDTVETRSNVFAIYLTVGFSNITPGLTTGPDTGEGNDSARPGVGILKSTDGGATEMARRNLVSTLAMDMDRASPVGSSGLNLMRRCERISELRRGFRGASDGDEYPIPVSHVAGNLRPRPARQ